MKIPSDWQIAEKAKLHDISMIIRKANIPVSHTCWNYAGNSDNIAKVNVDCLSKLNRPRGKFILTTAITPTPAGEGKTVTTIAMAKGLAQIGKKVIGCLREPALGPTLGIKGGAAGGGYVQVGPMDRINLFFTGDIPAVEAAHNWMVIRTEQMLKSGNELDLDMNKGIMGRCLDANDRGYRAFNISPTGKLKSPMKYTANGMITVASPIMASLCLAKGYRDLEKMLGNVQLGWTSDDKVIRAKDLGKDGSHLCATALLKDAMRPNLVQTIGKKNDETVPFFVHGGPFANIAHGTNSYIADEMALRLSDYVVTEAGFGADLGAVKFLDIFSRYTKLVPDAINLVVTCKALKMHGGADKKRLNVEDIGAIQRGMESNMRGHMEILDQFGIPYMISINVFTHDTERELKAIEKFCTEEGVFHARHTGVVDGSKGCIDMAETMLELLNKTEKAKLRKLYDLKMSLKEKIEAVCIKVHGAKSVKFYPKALKKLKILEKNGMSQYYICMAKTQHSLGWEGKQKGRPVDYVFPISDIMVNTATKFVIPIAGTPKTPMYMIFGLNKKPAGDAIRFDSKYENIKNLF